MEALALIVAVPFLILGIGAFVWPKPMQKAMLGFHILWLALAVIWSLYFWYAASTNQTGGWGGLAFYLVSMGIYPVTPLSVLTLFLFASLSRLVAAPFRFLATAIAAVKPDWVTWNRASIAVIAALVGTGIYAIVQDRAAKQNYKEIMQTKEVTKSNEQKTGGFRPNKEKNKPAKGKLSYFHKDWKEVLKEMEVYVPGEVSNTVTDYWGTPYRIIHLVPKLRKYNKYTASLEIISAGPDLQFDTGDDLKTGGHLTDLRRNSRGTFYYDRWIDSPTMVMLEEMAQLRAVVYPHEREPLVETRFELINKDKWGRNLGVEYSNRNSVASVTIYSAGYDGVFDTDDDLFVSRTRQAVDPTVSTQLFESFVTDSKTAQARHSTFELVKKLAIENAGLEQVATGFYDSRTARVLGEVDSWGRPLELYHVHPERSVVYVFSRGEDGIAGNFDDLVYAASDPSYIELLARVKGNLEPASGSAIASVFFEVQKSPESAGRMVQVILPGGGSKSSRDSLQVEFPAFHLATVEGNSCRVDLVDFVTIPPVCCPQSIPSNVAGRYQVAQECQVVTWNRAFPVAPEYVEFFDRGASKTVIGKELQASLPFGFLFASCEYHRKDVAEFFLLSSV